MNSHGKFYRSMDKLFVGVFLGAWIVLSTATLLAGSGLTPFA